MKRAILGSVGAPMKLVAIATAMSVSGCSFVLTKGPKDPPEPPSCTTSRGVPGIDAVIAMGSVIAAPIYGASSALTNNEDKKQERATTAGLLALTGITFLVSAIVGGVRVHRCTKATQNWNATQPPLGYGYPPPGYGPQGYPPPGQGYPPPGYGPQGYPPPGQGYPPSGQGYPPSGQGYPPPGQPQGYPPPQGYPAPQQPAPQQPAPQQPAPQQLAPQQPAPQTPVQPQQTAPTQAQP